MWMGYFFGNNPCSVTCLHEIGWFPMIQGMFAAGAPTHTALAQQLSFMLETATDSSGYVMPRWWIDGYYPVGMLVFISTYVCLCECHMSHLHSS